MTGFQAQGSGSIPISVDPISRQQCRSFSAILSPRKPALLGLQAAKWRNSRIVKGGVTQGGSYSHANLVVALSHGHQKQTPQEEHLYSYHVHVCGTNPLLIRHHSWECGTSLLCLCTYLRPRAASGRKPTSSNTRDTALFMRYQQQKKWTHVVAG